MKAEGFRAVPASLLVGAMFDDGVGLGLVGAGLLFGHCNPFRDNPTDEDVSRATLGIFLVGGLVIVGSAAIDVLAAPDHVTKANQARAEAAEGTDEARARSGATLSVHPLVSGGDGDGGIGLAATLRF